MAHNEAKTAQDEYNQGDTAAALNGRPSDARPRLLRLAWPALAIVAVALALAGLCFLRAQVTGRPVLGIPSLWALSFFLFAAAALLTLVDRRPYAGSPVWELALGAEPDAGGRPGRPSPAGPLATLTRSMGSIGRALRRAPLRSATLFVAVLLGVAVVLELERRADRVGSYWDLMALWSLSIVLYILAVRRPGWSPVDGIGAWIVKRRRTIGDLGLLWFAAAAIRLPGLGQWTPVINGDEGIVGNVARALAEGGTPFGTQFALGSLYYLLHTPPIIAFGGGIASLRVVDALIGSVTAPALYLAGRQMFGRRVGLVAGVLIAAQHMHLHFSRVALGQALDATLMALVLAAFMRGLAKRDPLWMAGAGVGLGLSQYGYVGGRALGPIFAISVLLMLLVKPRSTARHFRELAAAAGAAVLVALPMARWALVRPGDYMSRVQAMGFAQTGGLSWQAELSGHPEWLVWLGQLRDAFLAVLAHPARFFYESTIPMLNAGYGMLFVLGLGFAVWRVRDRRLMPLVVAALVAIVVLALGQNTAAAAYRVVGALPVFVLLAALALVLLARGAVAGFGWSRRIPELVVASAVAVLVVLDLKYYFVQHLPQCRYTDPASGKASLAGEYLGSHSRETRVFALTSPELLLQSYPSVEYLSDREVVDVSLFTPTGDAVGDGHESEGRPAIYSVPRGFGDLTPLMRGGPTVAIATQERQGELQELKERISHGELTSLRLCGEASLEALLVSR